MTTQYLGQLDVPMKAGIYLDCGALFPFYFKDAYNLNTTRWVGDICTWLKQFNIKTTRQVWQEANIAYNRVPLCKKEKRRIKPLYDKILATIDTITVPVAHQEGQLSTADLSLLHRPDADIPLLTADKALYRADSNAILLLWDKDLQQLSCVTEKVM